MSAGPSVGWDGVIDRYRAAIEHYPRMRSTLAVMLRLVETLQADPRFAGVEQHISHMNLMLWRAPARDRLVGVLWSEADGIGWAGSSGFAVYRRGSQLETSDKAIVSVSPVDLAQDRSSSCGAGSEMSPSRSCT